MNWWATSRENQMDIFSQRGVSTWHSSLVLLYRTLVGAICRYVTQCRTAILHIGIIRGPVEVPFWRIKALYVVMQAANDVWQGAYLFSKHFDCWAGIIGRAAENWVRSRGVEIWKITPTVNLSSVPSSSENRVTGQLTLAAANELISFYFLQILFKGACLKIHLFRMHGTTRLSGNCKSRWIGLSSPEIHINPKRTVKYACPGNRAPGKSFTCSFFADRKQISALLNILPISEVIWPE